MTDFVPQEAPFTGRKMFLIIFAFFGVIIAVNGTMLTMAVKTFGGLVVGNSYVASQQFNEDIAAAKAQPIRGWSLDLSTREDTISLAIHDRDGSALRDLSLSLTIARPTHERDTKTVTLTDAGDGVYESSVTLDPGQWIGTVSTADGQTRSLTFSHRNPAS